MLYFVRCKLVPATLKGEFIALYPEDKPKASAIVFEADLREIERIPATEGSPESIMGFVPVTMKNGFAAFQDERGLKFTPRNKDVLRVKGENEVRNGSVSAEIVDRRRTSTTGSYEFQS